MLLRSNRRAELETVQDYVISAAFIVIRFWKSATNVGTEIRVGNCYLDVLVRAECLCSLSSAARWATSSVASATRWKFVVRWPASDWVAIDPDSNTVLGHSACSASGIYSITNAWFGQWVLIEMLLVHLLCDSSMWNRKFEVSTLRSPYVQGSVIMPGTGFATFLRWQRTRRSRLFVCFHADVSARIITG